jgi:hypothetical protein
LYGSIFNVPHFLIDFSKDAKRLPVDLSVIDSVDLTSMIEEKKRQMNQLEKMKAKCLEKMSQVLSESFLIRKNTFFKLKSTTLAI